MFSFSQPPKKAPPAIPVRITESGNSINVQDDEDEFDKIMAT